MNVEFHIWLSVCVAMKSTWDNNLQCLRLTAFHCYIETTNQARNKNHLSRVYIFHPIICLTSVANLLSLFHLDVDYSFFFWKKINFGCHVISCKLFMDELFWQQSPGIIESGIGLMACLLWSITLLLYITKSCWRQSTCRLFLMKCGILLHIHCGYYFLPHFIWMGKIQDKKNIYT